MAGFLAIYSRKPLTATQVDGLNYRLSTQYDELKLLERQPQVAIWSSSDLACRESSSRSSPTSILAIGDVADQNPPLELSLALRQQRQRGLKQLILNYRLTGPSAACLSDEYHYILWDEERGLLVAGRDQNGVRPIFYSEQDHIIIIGSALRLVQLCRNSNLQNDDAVCRFVAGRPPSLDETYLRDIKRLHPGSCLVLKKNRIEQLKPSHAAFSFQRNTVLDDTIGSFRDAFTGAVRRRLGRSDETVALLSGGLDSSSITVIAAAEFARRGAAPLQTLSLVFDATPQWSERAFIEDVARRSQTSSQLINVINFAPFRGFSQLLEQQGGLFFAPGLNMGESLYEKVAGLNASIMLDGHGGDEAVSYGWGRLHDLAQAQQWTKMQQELAGVCRAWGTSPRKLLWLYYMKYGPLKRWVALALRARRALYLRRRSNPAETDNRLVAAHQRFRLSTQLDEEGGPSLVEGVLDHEASQHLQNVTDPRHAIGFEVLDAAASAAGVSVRYPFWDSELISLCVGLPSIEKLQGGVSRLILRKALHELPDSVRWRPGKMDFSPHLACGLLHHHGRLLEEQLAAPANADLWEYVDAKEARRLLGLLNERRERTPGVVVQAVWKVAALSLWLSQMKLVRRIS